MRDGRQTRSAQTRFDTREEDGKKRIEGYFVVFDSRYEIFDGATESVDRHAFDGALDDDIRALIDHETRLVLGCTSASTLVLRVDNHGLWGSIEINPEDGDAMNLYARAKRRDVKHGSFGFEILKERTEVDPTTGAVHWIIEQVKLYEVSCVTFPAYKETAITARAEEYRQIQQRRAAHWAAQRKERLKQWVH